MPALLLPVIAINQPESNDPFPADLQPFLLPNAHKTTVLTDGGSAYVQARTINGFSLAYLIFRVQRPIRITCVSEEASGILHYVLQGNFPSYDVAGVTVSTIWNEQEFGLSYSPKGFKILLVLEKGEHHFFQIAFSFHLLVLLMRTSNSFQMSTGSNPANPFFTTPFPINKNINKLLEHTLKILHQHPDDILRLHNLLLQLISRFLKGYGEKERDQYWQQKKELQFAELENYIPDHLHADDLPKLAPSLLAKKTRTNLYQFHKLFRAQYGVSLTVYIKQKRMEKAVQLLTETSLPAGDIYQAVGYEDFSSFSRAFALYFGYPPSRLRGRS